MQTVLLFYLKRINIGGGARNFLQSTVGLRTVKKKEASRNAVASSALQ